MEGEGGRGEDERGIGSGTTELVEFEERGMDGEFGVRGAALERKFGGFDDAGFEERCEAGGLTREKGFLECGEAVGDFAHGGGAGVGRVQTVGEGARAGFEGRAETGEAEFGEGDLAVGEGFAEGEATGPLEGLRERDRPRGAFAGQGAGRIADAFVAGGEREFGIGASARGAHAGFGGGDFGLVEGEFGVARSDFGNEGVEFDGGLGGAKRRGAHERSRREKEQ